MKKFLSMVLALVMVMSLVTVSAGAKDFTDNDTITYDEAVAVVSEVGIVDGYADGKFNPTNTLTRQAAAKIICNLILGPTTAAELHADTAPYRDVPANNEFAGYIAYCQSKGIISGYADGAFRPGNTLTGYAFMKMLLGALGYDATLERYVGDNWSINVAKQAIGIGLNRGLEGEFNGIKAVTREEACLYAFNTLQADLVEYGQRLTTSINGTEVTLSTGGAQSRKWNSQQTRIDHIREDDIIQFAEEYFRKLEKKRDQDQFMRPSYTWIYDKTTIGTYVDWELLVEEYTSGVSVRDLYDAIGANLISDDDMELTYYVNGVEPVANSGLPTWVAASDGSANLTKTGEGGSVQLRRSNQNDAGISDNGVLTQLFIDKDHEEIIITSIDTWLSKADADYNENKEGAPMSVWTVEDSDTSKTYNVDVADVPEIEDVTEDTFYLLSISFKDDLDNGEVVHIWEPDIMEASVVTKFSTKQNEVPSKVTTGGTEYKQAARGYYDPKALYDYNETLLTDRTYNIIMDQYGYFIGIELEEGTKNYVFITGFDRPVSNLSVQTADAAGIFLDGTMQAIKVNVSNTDKNIASARKNADNDAGKYYFLRWQDIVSGVNQAGKYDGFYALNRWYTYTKTEAGVYTLKPATNMVIHNYGPSTNETIKTANLYFDDNVMMDDATVTAGGGTTNTFNNPYYGLGGAGNGTAINTELGVINAPEGTTLENTDGRYTYKVYPHTRVYGNDDSVYLTVDVDDVDTNSHKGAITDVTGVYTGVQNVEIEIETAATGVNTDRPLEEGEIFAVYDADHYIIGAVTNGEGKGNNATIAYVLDTVKSERIEGDTYYWEFEAVIGGEVKTLTAKSKFENIFTDVINAEADASHKKLAVGDRLNLSSYDWNTHDGLVELRFDATEEYVVSAKPVLEKDIYSYYGNRNAATGTAAYRGNNSLTTDAVTTAPGSWSWSATGSNRLDIGDAKAYRVGAINENAVNAAGVVANYGWNDGTNLHHYDSAPTELTLAGRTLYVTPQSGSHTYVDEGLALQSDAKAVVIQRENGKWKTREFGSVKSALAQIVDVDETTPGLQYRGEVVAVMGSNGAAAWVVFTSYEDMVSGGGGYVPTQRVYNVSTQYIDPDGIGTDAGQEYVAFRLWGTTQGKAYTVTLKTNFGGIETTRTKTVIGQSGSTSLYVGTNNGFYGKLDENTFITVICEDGVGTYMVPNTPLTTPGI
ncbi:S-layer homology domain-containing protein [uncultured Oscillibacter sp.]|uniref:S-layer homology domain-containing protein n=1 Tax=uncultured Oscillibacter sp. TaxID=876091 RepID=UPI00261C5642|nr:S-layer homology domain-containing protein [uncultured Oscillibacter sp.]